MTALLLLKLLLSIIFVAAMILLNFALFRIPIKHNDKQIAFLALIVGTANFYFKFILVNPHWFLFQSVVYIVALMILRKYPILYALIVCLVCSLLISLLEAGITIAALQLGLTTTNVMTSDTLHFTVFHLIETSVFVLIAFLLSHYKIGFSFIVRRFGGMEALKPYNFIWAVILILGAFYLQISSDNLEVASYRGWIFIVLTLLSIGSLYYAYRQNIKALQARKEAFGSAIKKYETWRREKNE